MRVLLLGPIPPETGGVSSHISDLAVALAGRGHQITVLAREWGKGQVIDRKPLAPGVMVRWIPDGILGRARWPLEILRAAAASDVLHAHTFRLGCLSIALLKGKKPLVFTVHGYFSRELRALEARHAPVRRWFYERLEQGVVRRADAVIAVDEGRAKWALGLGGRSVTRIPNGLELTTCSPLPLDKRSQELVYVGYLYPQKGVQYAMRATALLNGDWRLTVVGTGPMGRALREEAVRLGILDRVDFQGSLPRDQAVVRIGRAFAALVPSVPLDDVGEATSISALEAMGRGTPVIASRIGGLAEIIRNGETGFLVEPGDASAIASCVHRLARDPSLWQGISRRAREYVETFHDWRSLVLRVEEIYERAIDDESYR